MVTTNALDLSSQGVAYYNGTGTFSAPSLTQHGIILGDASNDIKSLGVATNGQIPIGSAGADPVLATITAGTGISVTNGAGSITIAATGGGSGNVVQQVRTSSTTPTSTSTRIGLTGTTPTTSNTTSLITQSFTPTNASNILIFDFCAPFLALATPGTGDQGGAFFLFAGSTLLSCYPYTSIVATPGIKPTWTSTFRFFMTAGTTSPTTYGVYYAGTSNSSVNANVYMLQDNAGNPFFNGANTSIEFTITEVTP